MHSIPGTSRRKAIAFEQKELLRHIVVLTLVLGALYALCRNGCWLPLGSDDAFHLDIARNLALGLGLTANGAPVIHTPPGFPALLSLVMRVTPQFSVLNGGLVFFMLGAVIMWYLVLRRYTSPSKALAVMLVTGILFEWHRFSYTHYTESLSYFLLGGAMLLAVQFGEGRSAGWRVPLLALLCALVVLVNWRGLLSVILVGGALFTGRSGLSSPRKWVIFALIVVVSAATMFVTLHALESRAERIRAQGSEIERGRADDAIKNQRGRLPRHLGIGPSEALRRVSEAGEWVFLLLWPPATVAKKHPGSKLAVNLLGWLLIVFYSLRLPNAVRSGQWIWLAAAAFLATLIVIRWYSLPRYIAPAAPLILLGIWDGIERLADSRPFARSKRIIKACAVLGIIGVMACNLMILAVQVWIVQSPDFQKKYQGGEYLDTLRISAYLKTQACGGGPVALMVRYADLNRSDSGGWAERSLSFMTGCLFLHPGDRIRSVKDPEFPGWAARHDVKYVVNRPEKLATRFWHFREPLLNRGDERAREPFYELYKIEGAVLKKVTLPRVIDDIRRVPGLQ